MSSMLEQAIVDAEQLKETAKMTAEEGVVEKYQDEIKEAIEKILEQDEGAEAEMAATPEGDLELVDELPAAQTADQEEVVEINLNQLEEMMAQELEEEGLKAEDMLSREQIAEELEEIAEEGKEVDLDENDLLELAEEDEEEIDLDETNLAAVIAEMLGADDESDEEEVVEEAVVEEDTEDNTTELEETNVVLTQEAKSLVRKNTSLLKEQTRTEKKVHLLKEKVDKYGTVIKKLKTKLNESNLTNAKLLYQNRILNSVSLNERQKDKIVEAISNATTVEEAKLIFETLQSAVGVSKKKRSKRTESLNEVVTRSSSAFIPRKEVQPKADAFSERMKRLAGLK
jgi:hypothetical protein